MVYKFIKKDLKIDYFGMDMAKKEKKEEKKEEKKK